MSGESNRIVGPVARSHDLQWKCVTHEITVGVALDGPWAVANVEKGSTDATVVECTKLQRVVSNEVEGAARRSGSRAVRRAGLGRFP